MQTGKVSEVNVYLEAAFDAEATVDPGESLVTDLECVMSSWWLAPEAGAGKAAVEDGSGRGSGMARVCR
jgi:hypothetical protein